MSVVFRGVECDCDMYDLSKSSLCLMLLFVFVITVSLSICARLSIVIPKVPTRTDPYVFSGW